VICSSTSGRIWTEFEKRAEVIALRPDMCSLTLSSFNFINQVSLNSPDMVVKLAEVMNEHGVVPELECFDMGMINYGMYLIRKGLILGPFYWNLLFGNIAGFQANLLQMGTAINSIPPDHYIGLAGLGSAQLKVNAIAIAMGLGVRVGIEDNIWWDEDRIQLTSNIELIRRIHQIIEIHGGTHFKAEEFGNLGFYNRKK
jgi:uncharacterized protein (DUF849 family)